MPELPILQRPHRLGWLAAALAVLALAGCGRLPSLDGRAPSAALEDTADTLLGAAIAPAARAHPGRSGIHALSSGRDAFAARMRLAEAAQRSLDVQYYIWRRDLSGTLLLDAVRRAADRGVRVRLLLDDNNTPGLDDVLSALAAHPRIEVRLFNPFAWRRWRLLGYVGDFARLNRRMHNKSFTADNQATVIGGRNVGDEYFGAGQDLLYVDLDVLAVGPVVREVSADFDRYWSSASAYPVERLLPPPAARGLDALASQAHAVRARPAAREYLQALAGSTFVQQLVAGRLPLEWAPVRLLSDDPAKVLGQAEPAGYLWTRLQPLLQQARHALDLVSPYFVPGEVGVGLLAGLAAHGVEVRVLTNSLAATDVPVVHAGYARRREALLARGVALFEMKPSAAAPPSADRHWGGSSDSSLHAKAIAIDGWRVFIGSFNFDPRSARLNTEMGFVIDSAPLARAMQEAMRRNLPAHAWAVRLAADGRLAWEGRADGEPVVVRTEPGTGWGRRTAVRLLGLLPIEWML